MKKRQNILFLFTAVLFISFVFPSQAIGAPLEDDRTVFGETYILESGNVLDGDLVVIGGVVEIEEDARVNGNAAVIGGLVTIDGTITGDLTAIGGTVNLGENAVIQGDLISPASYINRDPGAVVQGDQFEGFRIPRTNFTLPEFRQPNTFMTPQIQLLKAVNWIGRGIAFTLMMTALGALLLLIMPNSVEVMTKALETKPWEMLGYGALTAFVMLVGGVLFSITVCLIPIVILVGLAFSLAVLVGWLTLGYELGKKIAESIFKTSWHPVLSGSVGNLILFLIAGGLDLIPCIGGFLVLIAMLFGLGMVVVTLLGTNPYPRGILNENKEKVVLFEEKAFEEPIDPMAESSGIIKKEQDLPGRPIEDLGLSSRLITILKNAGLHTVPEVLDHLNEGDDAFLTLSEFGQKSLEELKNALRQSGYEVPGSTN